MNSVSQLAAGQPVPACAPPRAEPVFRPMALLSVKLSLAMLAPLLMSLYVARLVAQQGDLIFSGYSIVSSTNMALFIIASSLFWASFFASSKEYTPQRPSFSLGMGGCFFSSFAAAKRLAAEKAAKPAL